MKKKLFNPEISNAIRAGDVQTLNKLLDMYPKHINCFTSLGGGTWLHYAAGEGKLEVVKCMVKRGFDINKESSLNGGTPLADAASEGHVDVSLYLIEQGANLEITGKGSSSNPLFAAIIAGAPEIVTALLSAGIDTSVTYGEDNDVDALVCAFIYGKTEIAKLIATDIAEGDIHKANEYLKSATRTAKKFGPLQQFQILPQLR